jgi:P2 family phage contractile tail tube protein
MALESNLIPEVINNYNVYADGEQMIGVADDITLPSIKNKTISVSGAGLLGEVNTPSPGNFESFEQEIKFNLVYSSMVNMLSPLRQVNLTFRGAQQAVDKSLGYSYKSLRIVEIGRVKEFTPGKMKRSEGMDASVKLEVTYFLMESDGEEIVCVDKLNGIYRVNGEDMLADIAAMI